MAEKKYTRCGHQSHSFLVSRENYDRARTLHEKNLIFCVSIVENYLRSDLRPGLAPSPLWPAWTKNVASLPIDDSSLFIRWLPGAGRSNWLASIAEFVRTGEVREDSSYFNGE